MIEQLPQVFTLSQQLNDATHHAQLRTNTSARPDSAQQLLAILALNQRTTDLRQHCERHSHQQEHPRPCLNAVDARLHEAEQSFAIAEAFFAREPKGVLRSHRISRHWSVRQQVPDAPSAFRVTCARLRQIDAARVSLRVPDSPPSTPSVIASPAQRIESAPLLTDAHFVVRL